MGLLIGRGCEISHASSVYASLVLPQASSGDGTSRGCYMLIVVEEEEQGSEMNSVLLCCRKYIAARPVRNT